MMRKATLLLVALLGIYLPSHAQLCAADGVNQQLMANNPAYAATMAQNAIRWAQLQGNPNSLVINTTQGVAYEIPVVVHVMNTGGAIGTNYNPTDIQLTGMIAYLNASYAATYAAYPDTNNGGTYIPIRFKLAQRYNCAATSGIDRFTVTNTQYVNNGVNSNINNNIGGLDDTTLKNYDRWPTSDYYNIWVVNKIDGVDGYSASASFVAGFAYFAGSPAVYDGTIMLASQAIAGQITLPHEIGHAMGLYHTFRISSTNGGNTTTCPPNTNCTTQGDEVCDTEPMMMGSPSTCPTGINPCTGLAWANTQKNFMNYSNCQNRFTPGQRTKALFNLQLYRASLLSSLGGYAPGATVTSTSCTPTITNAGNQLDYGPQVVSLNDLTESTDGYTGDNYQQYLDKTCVQRANLVAGSSYTFNVTVGTNGAQNVRAWIDYNNDGVFATTEQVLTGTSTTNNGTVSATFTVPSTGLVTCTPLRMRVMADATSNTTMSACGPLQYGQTEDYSVYIKPASSNSTVSIALTTGSNPSCTNTPLTFTATPSTGTSTPTYKWYLNNTYTGITTNTYSTTTAANNDQVRVLLSYINPCGQADSAYSNTITILRSTGALTASVSLALTSGSNPGCAGQTYTFTATAVNGGTAPSFAYKINGVTQLVTTSNTFTTSAPVNGNTVSVTLTSNATCVTNLTANSNVITIVNITVTPSVTIAVTSGSNPGCSGQPITFTATPVNGGTAPTYDWKINGTIVQSGTSNTYTSTSLSAGNTVTTTLTSNYACALPATANSNGIAISFTQLTATATIAILTGTNPTCAGKPILFYVTTTNGGTAPVYLWLVNGASTGANGNTFSTTALHNGDSVNCLVISNNPCVTNQTVLSNKILMTVIANDSAYVKVALTQGLNPGCKDSLVQYTATASHAGLTPVYAWYVNGVKVANGNTFTSTTLLNGDKLVARVIVTPGCYVKDTVYSDTVTLVRNTVPTATRISLIGNMLVADSPHVQWYGPSGMIAAPAGTSQSFRPTAPGLYYAVVLNNGCNSASSNVLLISALSIGGFNTDGVQVYPNPASQQIVIDWGTKPATSTINIYDPSGQIVLRDVATNVSRKSLDISGLANGMYFIVLQDEQGKTGTVRITVVR